MGDALIIASKLSPWLHRSVGVVTLARRASRHLGLPWLPWLPWLRTCEAEKYQDFGTVLKNQAQDQEQAHNNVLHY